MKINKKSVLKNLLITIVILLIYSPLLIGHYSTDTYRLIEMGYNKYSIEYSLNDGRIFMYIIGQIAAKINININMYVILLTFLAIIISVICIILIEKILKKYNKREQSIIVALIAYVTIMNFMYLENLYFTECIVMAMSILLYIIAAKMLNEGGNILKIFLLVLLGVFCYQGTINVFITFYFLFALIENKTINKTILKNMCIVLSISLISIAINMLQIKLCGKIYGLEQTRTGKINEIWFNIVYIIKNIDTLLIQSSDLFPKYVFLIFLTLIMICIVIWDKKEKEGFNNFINIVLLTIVAIVSSVIINVVSLSSFGLGRMVFSVGALIGMIYMYLYSTTAIMDKKTFFKYIMIIILVGYTIINICNTLNILISHQRANKLDKQEALQANKFIDEYENESGIKVKHIAVAYDNDITWNYKEIKHKSLYTHRALMIWWCNVQTINYFGNRNLEKVPMDTEIYNENFYGKNWDSLNKEQFVFKGDTLYYCVY